MPPPRNRRLGAFTAALNALWSAQSDTVSLSKQAPHDERAAATVISTSVLSHDRGSILVEAGGFTPTRWFLEQGLQHAVDSEQPPQKRRKTEPADPNPPADVPPPSASQQPLLFQVSVDFVFGAAENSTYNDEAIETDTIPVYMAHRQDGEDFARLHLQTLQPKGPILVIEFADLAELTLRHLFSPVFYDLRRTPSSTSSATSVTCKLSRLRGPQGAAVRLTASVRWQSGMSAFSRRWPKNAQTFSPDYNILLSAFPDKAKNPDDGSRRWTPRDFYDSVHATSGNADDAKSFEGVLESTLYPFQGRAVSWLLRREGVTHDSGRLVPISPVERREQAVDLVAEHVDLDGHTCYVDHLRGIISASRPEDSLCQVSGGLLAEEMGLGKTVELLTLISLHRRPDIPVEGLKDEVGNLIQPSNATLIITPASIVQQWQSELARHAPSLRVSLYTGVPTGSDDTKKASELLRSLTTDYDVVLVTYNTLAKEIHFAEDPPKRDMRHARRYERKRSPLVQIQWWRICLDEAQMLESGVTNAARVACRLPRVHSWAVSGTPLRKDVQDLCGLLIFLRFRPFSDDPQLWSHLLTNHRHLFRKIFSKIALRHTKSQIRHELVLPPQKRVVVTMPFSVLENQNYSEMFDLMCRDVGLDQHGAPLTDEWNPKDSSIIESMRSWLIRLRQTCLHPQVGVKNRRALGRGTGPLRTVAEVLEIMIEQNEANLRQEEKTAIDVSLTKAHILGFNKADPQRSQKALEIYQVAMSAAEEILQEARQRLARAEIAQSEQSKSAAELAMDDMDAQTDAAATHIGNLRSGVRAALQLYHTCTFFCATAYFQIKSDESLTEPESSAFHELEKKEVELYDKAKVVRKEILKEGAAKAGALMETISSSRWIDLPKIRQLQDFGGIESRRILEKADALFEIVGELAELILSWRSKMADYLTRPLVDKDEEGESTGEEYEASTKEQDELYAYFDAFKVVQADLSTLITGETNALTDHESKTIVLQAKRFLDPEVPEPQKPSVHAPNLALELFELRNKLRARSARVSSLRGLISEARFLESTFYGNETGPRAGEKHIVQRQLGALQDMFAVWSKITVGLDKELTLFRNTQNQRVEFYRQLQEISDAVAPYKEELDETLDLHALGQTVAKEEQSNKILAQLKTKNRFLVHLRDESTNQTSPRICVICQCTFERGVLTVCGHQYCKECIENWFTQSRSCPICKRRLTKNDIHDIIFKPQQLRLQEETHDAHDETSQPSHQQGKRSAGSSIYTDVDSQLMDDIRSIDLPVSYGTKIDTIGRHLLYLRERDAGAKSIVFSQYREFLDVLSTALRQFKINHTRLGRPNAAETFKNDPSMDCLLLDAKTDSSGLTLVSATNVFICEPLVQTAVELQAIARVHRIGQTRPTTVWMYIISDTVEESIYELSVARRLAHVQSRAAVPNETAIDAANSEELTSAPLTKLLASGKAGGENVKTEDLWQCLFGKKSRASIPGDIEAGAAVAGEGTLLQTEVARHLRAEAAERRIAETTK